MIEEGRGLKRREANGFSYLTVRLERRVGLHVLDDDSSSLLDRLNRGCAREEFPRLRAKAGQKVFLEPCLGNKSVFAGLLIEQPNVPRVCMHEVEGGEQDFFQSMVE